MVSKKDIVTYVTIVKDNNLSGLLSSLLNRGFVQVVKAPEKIVGSMLAIYLMDKEAFYSIMRSVPYNKGAGNYTTSMNFHKLVGRTPELKLYRARKAQSGGDKVGSVKMQPVKASNYPVPTIHSKKASNYPVPTISAGQNKVKRN